jgi:hypothetical protein
LDKTLDENIFHDFLEESFGLENIHNELDVKASMRTLQSKEFGDFSKTEIYKFWRVL